MSSRLVKSMKSDKSKFFRSDRNRSVTMSFELNTQNYDMKFLKKQNVFEIRLIKQQNNTKNENIDENRQISKITIIDDEK